MSDVLSKEQIANIARYDGTMRYLCDSHEALRAEVYRLSQFEAEVFGVLFGALMTDDATALDLARALSTEVEALRAEVASLRADLEDSRDREHRLRSERDGNVWLWQGDEDDHPESLTCQVLIRPDDLRALLAARDTARPEGGTL